MDVMLEKNNICNIYLENFADKLWVCLICDKGYVKNYWWNNHIRTIHNGNLEKEDFLDLRHITDEDMKDIVEKYKKKIDKESSLKLKIQPEIKPTLIESKEANQQEKSKKNESMRKKDESENELNRARSSQRRREEETEEEKVYKGENRQRKIKDQFNETKRSQSQKLKVKSESSSESYDETNNPVEHYKKSERKPKAELK